MSRFCHNCGTELPDDAVFCSGCGTRVKLAETPKAEPVQAEVEVPKAEPVQAEVETPKVEPVQAEVEAPKAEPVQAEVVTPKVEPAQPDVEAPKPEPIQPTMSEPYIGGNSFNQNVSSTQPIPGFGAPGGTPKKDKPKKKKTGLIVSFVLVFLLAAGAATVWFLDQKGIIEIFPKEEESTYKEAIDLYVKGLEHQDIDTFLDAYGSFLVDDFANGAGTEFMEEVYEQYEDEVGSEIKIKYEVTKEKEYSESKLKDLQQDLEEDYDLKATIEKAYDITTEFTIEGEDGTTDDKVKFLVVEINGQWYLAEFDD